jgi:hypothetical protein
MRQPQQILFSLTGMRRCTPGVLGGGGRGGPPLYRQTDSIMTVEGTEPPACQTVSSWTCNHLQCTLKEFPREIMPRTKNIFKKAEDKVQKVFARESLILIYAYKFHHFTYP